MPISVPTPISSASTGGSSNNTAARTNAAIQGSAGIGTFLLDSLASKRESKAKAKIQADSNRINKEQFDYRYGQVNDSDKRIGDLLTRQNSETGALADNTFGYLLGEDRANFDEQMGALDVLTTTNRAARLQQQAASDAERERQHAFQGQADALAAVLPGQIGYQQQSADAAAATAGREALAKANMNPPANAPAYASDGPLGAAFSNAASAGVSDGMNKTSAQARIAGVGDAFQGSERRLGDFAQAIAALTQQAQLSRAALPAELAAGDARKTGAQSAYDWTTKIADDFHKGNTASQSSYASNASKMLDDYFNNAYDTDNAYTSKNVGTSKDTENTLIGLNNYKAENTHVTSPLSSILKVGAKAAGAFFGGGGG